MKVSVGTFLKDKRVARGLTQLDLANLLGFTSAQFISNIERDLALPPMRHLRTFMRALNISEQEMYELISRHTDQILRESVFGPKAKSKKAKKA